jgi:peptidoglycan/LPS O-acetylase OafA/YrhL
LLLALAVVTSHEWRLGGYGPEPQVAHVALGQWAVAGFFALSGFLVTQSRLRSALPTFFLRRVLRIYPGFLVCLLVVALVFAPLSVALGSGSVNWDSAATYVTDNALLKIEQNGIHATLTHAPFGTAWDGSLWTLFYDFGFYVALGVILCVGIRWHRRALAAIWLAWVAAETFLAPHVHDSTVHNFLYLGSLFFAGAVMALYADRIRSDWRLCALCLGWLAVIATFGDLSTLGGFAIAYLCLFLGTVLPFGALARRYDLSFGVFLYAFPIQQLLTQLPGPRLPVQAALALAIGIAIPVALISWIAVEEPAHRLRDRLGRAATAATDRDPEAPVAGTIEPTPT